MATFYEDMATVALDLLSEFGSQQTLRDITPGTYDPATGVTTGDVALTQSARVILLDYTLKEAGQIYAEGSEIKKGDKKIIVAAKGLTWAPRLTTRVDVAGVLWSVVNIKESNPAGTPLVYFLQGRK